VGVAGEAIRTVRINFVGDDRGAADTIAGVKTQLVAVAAVAGAAKKGLDALNEETARLDKIAKEAQKTGLGFDAYQRLAQVSKLAGSNVTTLAKGAIRLTRNLNDLAGGRGEKVAENLERLNLTLEDLQGLETTEQLAILSDALLGVESEAQKSAIAVELFGRSGAEMIPLLNSGSESIREMQAGVGKLFTREELARAEAYQDALANMEKATSDLAGSIAVEMAPAIQKQVESLTASAQALGESEEFTDALGFAVGRVEAVVKTAASVVGFFAGQLAVLGNVANLAGDEVGQTLDTLGGMLEETDAAGWARETVAAFSELGGDSVRRVTDALVEQIPALDELNANWAVLRNTILNTSGDQKKLLTTGQKALAKFFGAARDLAREQEKSGGKREQALEAEAVQAEHLVRLAQAQKRPAAEIERLLRAQHDARIALLMAAGDQAAVQKELRDEEVRQAAAARRGGTGPSQADRFRAASEAGVAALEQQARLSAALAQTDEARAAADDQAAEAELARLRVERESLDLVKARGVVAKQELEAKKQALDAAITLAEVERGKARDDEARRRLEEENELFEARAASAVEAEKRVVSLGAKRAQIQATALEREAGIAAAEAQRATRASDFAALQDREAATLRRATDLRLQSLQEQAALEQLVFDQREAFILAHPPETELDRLRQRDELAQLAHDRELSRIEAENEAATVQAALRQRLDEQAAKREEAIARRRAQAFQTTEQLMSQGFALASKITTASIKDGEKRARAELRVQGIQAMAVGALETVKAAASFASLNIAQGVLHTAAAALAFVQGGIMLAGNVPSQSGASAGGGASAAASAPIEREASPVGRTVESIPAADQEPRPRLGETASAGNVVNINVENVAGGFDETAVEDMAIQLRSAGFALEGA
jgi:hypothetical protein